jgi:hypothetical protein
MSQPIVAYENFAAHAEASLSCAQADSSFPASYLTDWDAARQMRLTAAAWTISLTLPFAREVDFIALLHTTNLGGTEITVKGRALASESLSTLGTIQMGSGKNGRLLLSSATMLSEIQLSVSGGGSEAGGSVDPHEVPLGAAPGYGRIGQLYVGKSVTLGRTYSVGYSDTLRIPTLGAATEGGSRFRYQLGQERRAQALTWNALTDSVRSQLLALFRATKGDLYPFCLIDLLGELNFVRGPGSLQWRQLFLTTGALTLALSEEPMPLDPEAS